MRRLLAIYMTFVLVAGPSLCCCATMFAAVPPPAAPERPSPEPTSPCCHKRSPPATAGEQGGKSPSAPKPDKNKCPCQDDGGKPSLDQATPSSLTAPDVARLLITILDSTVVGFITEVVADSALGSGGGPSPSGHRLTSWRLLQADHMLRC